MGSDEHVCPTCGQPVETVVRRHKTLGTWVPKWVAGPCRNPDCGAYDAEDSEAGRPAEGARPAEHAGTARSAEGSVPAVTTRPVTTPAETAPPETAPGETVTKNP
ncbi:MULTISPECIES: hypothetical protein [unclassified Streptomyces]|jgi:hypothetical protein|uniref:hypothetical protein n=1 Tax=unclassified Streptomyces TaxID=2593676 RepID=UPI003CEF4DF0